MSSWIKIGNEDDEGLFEGYDIVIRKSGILYIPKKSPLREYLRKTNFRYDLYVDEDGKKIALVPNSNGEFKMWSVFYKKMKKKGTAKDIQLFLDILKTGMFSAVKGNVEGREGFIFERKW